MWAYQFPRAPEALGKSSCLHAAQGSSGALRGHSCKDHRARRGDFTTLIPGQAQGALLGGGFIEMMAVVRNNAEVPGYLAQVPQW